MKAIALISGGLDSALATYIIKAQNIEVIGLNFKSVFFDSTCYAENVAMNLGIPIVYKDISEPLLELIKQPKYGFGKNLNPCIDCHILMVKEALKLKEKEGADFIITGEVLGERGKSQNRMALRLVEEESGAKGYLLRPLSAKLLDETEVEKKGWINRNNLYKLQGRSRRAQLYFAEKYKLEGYSPVAGGCLLTDPNFSRKLKHLLSVSSPQIRDIELLKIGRHILLDKNKKVIVGRNIKENQNIIELARPEDKILRVKGDGANLLLQAFGGEDIEDSDLIKAGYIAIHYSYLRNAREKVTIEVKDYLSFKLLPDENIKEFIKEKLL